MSYEAHEVRAFGLMLADMVRRMDIGFQGESEGQAGFTGQALRGAARGGVVGAGGADM